MIDRATRYREFVEDGLLAVYDCTASGQLLCCNDAFARLFGFASAADAVGADLTGFYMKPAHRAVLLDRIRAEGRVQNVRGKVRTRSGRIAHVIMSAIGEFDGDGVLVGLHGHLIDITESMEAQRAMARRARELTERLAQAEKIETVGRLAGGIAHDFNNLLTAILGYSELLLTNPGIGDAERRDIAEIQKAGQRAATLTQQLLAFGRKQVLLPKDVDLNATVASLEAMLARLIRENISLQCDLAADPAVVRIDPTQIEQVLLNLVLNARDALPGGGFIRLDVSRVKRSDVELRRDAQSAGATEFVRLRVTDNGVGISEEVRSHLFEPFFTTKEVGKGTGLGLASVYGIVKQSHGFIDVESSPGCGSCFSLYFPAVQPVKTTVDAPVPVAPALATEETILLVEDEDVVRRIVGTVLRRHGYRVLEAPTPERACELFADHGASIDLLVSDVVMPEMSGPALAQRLVGVRPDLRILFISGYTDAVSPLDAISPNVAFLGKPFQGSALLDRVREMLAREPKPHTRTISTASCM